MHADGSYLRGKRGERFDINAEDACLLVSTDSPRRSTGFARRLPSAAYLESRSSSTSNPSCLTARLKSCGLVEAATATL